MPYTTEQLLATQQANAEVLQGLSIQVFSGLEKLVELNLAANRAALTESFSYLQALISAKDPQQLLALQSGLFQPLAEQAASYGRHVNSIATETGAEFSRAFSALLENAAASAPAGTEGAVAAFKSAVSAGQKAIETAQDSAQKAVELAESNFTAVTQQAFNAASAATDKT